MFPRTKMMSLFKSRILPLIFAILVLSTATSFSTVGESVLVIIDDLQLNTESLSNIQSFINSVPGILVLSPLLYMDIYGMPHKVLAEEIKVLPGNKVIDIRLRDGVRFHDGRRLTAYDVVASINRLREIDKILEVKFRGIKTEALNSLTLRLTSDVPIFDVNVIVGNIQILPPAGSGVLNGSGPFRFGRWLDNGVELVANEDYFEGRPKLDRIIYLYEEKERKRLYKLLNGEADLMLLLSPEATRFLEKDSRFYVREIPYLYFALYFNMDTPLFQDNALRRAVSMAIDRDSLIGKVFKGGVVKTSHPFSPKMLPKTISPIYQPKEAARLLKEAGWNDLNKDGILEKNGRKLRFLLYYNKYSQECKELVGAMRQHLYEVGIEMESVPVDYSEFKKKHIKAGDYDIFLAGHSTSDSVNLTIWHSSMVGKHEGENLSRYSNMQVDRLLEKLRLSSDMEAKRELYGKIMEILNEDVPAAFLFNNKVTTAVSKRFNGAEEFVGSVYSVYKIKDWSVNEDFR